jgi:hypothetical protein
VVIAWRESAELLRRCVLAIEGQGVDQLVVSRSTEAEFSDALLSEFPHVQWIEHSGACNLPELHWLALPEVRSDVAAFLEAPSIPGSGWAAAHRQARRAHPEILVCGGPVRIPKGADAWELGWYWSDYAAYAPGRASGQTRDLTDANVSYKSRELRANESLLTEAGWGWRIRNASTLMSYYDTSAWIDYPCPYPPKTALRQRWSAGCAHGAVQRPGIVGRVWAIVTFPLLPIVLAWRCWQGARCAGSGLSYVRALPWVLVFHIWWTCGELAGLLSGRGAH